MDKYRVEIFAEFTYSQKLTYEDLLTLENGLRENMESIFQSAGAEHLDFTPMGDLLMFQCAFEARNLEILRDVAQEMAAILPEGVSGLLMCLEKNLASYHLFWLKPRQWSEKECKLPRTAPPELPVYKI